MQFGAIDRRLWIFNPVRCINDDQSMELNHEELAFNQGSFWRFCRSPNLINKLTAACLFGVSVSKAAGFTIG